MSQTCRAQKKMEPNSSTPTILSPTQEPAIDSSSWVFKWLSKVNLSKQYTPHFISNGYDNALVCSSLDEGDLDMMGIKIPGHRKTLLLHSKRTNPNDDDKILSGDQPSISLQSQMILTSNYDDPSATHNWASNVSNKKKEPIMAKSARQLEGLNYWTRAKARTTPWDDHLPNRETESTAKLRILLVRHAQSQANVDMSLYTRMADHAIPLSSEGERQAIASGEEIARYFRRVYNQPDHPTSTPPRGHHCRIWTSSYLRARQTSELIKAHSSGYVTDIRENILLVEQQFGLFEGTDWYSGTLDEEFPKELMHYQKAAAFGGRFWAQVPLGESRFQVCQRVYLSFGTLHRDARRHGINNVIIVSHGVTLRAFMAMWLHLTPEWFEEEPNPPNASIRVIDDCVDKGYIWPHPKKKESKHNEAPDFQAADTLVQPRTSSGETPSAPAPANGSTPTITPDLSTSVLLDRKNHIHLAATSTGSTAAPPPPCAEDPHADGSDLLLRKSQSIPLDQSSPMKSASSNSSTQK